MQKHKLDTFITIICALLLQNLRHKYKELCKKSKSRMVRSDSLWSMDWQPFWNKKIYYLLRKLPK